MNEQTEHDRQIVDQFSQQAEGYRRLTDAMAPNERPALFRSLVEPEPDDLALDVCCGPGTITLALAPHVSHVTGLDVTPAMLEQARAGQMEKGLANVAWVEGAAYALPFDDGAFSLVLCCAAFHHLTDPGAAFREMVRVCRPGGRIVVRDMTPAPGKVTAYDAMERLRDPSHAHALTTAELSALGAGLAVSEPGLTSTVTADLPLDAILATSFPESVTIEDIRARFREDALSGEDQLGFSARIIDGAIWVSYPMTTAVWARR